MNFKKLLLKPYSDWSSKEKFRMLYRDIRQTFTTDVFTLRTLSRKNISDDEFIKLSNIHGMPIQQYRYHKAYNDLAQNICDKNMLLDPAMPKINKNMMHWRSASTKDGVLKKRIEYHANRMKSNELLMEHLYKLTLDDELQLDN